MFYSQGHWSVQPSTHTPSQMWSLAASSSSSTATATATATAPAAAAEAFPLSSVQASPALWLQSLQHPETDALLPSSWQEHLYFAPPSQGTKQSGSATALAARAAQAELLAAFPHRQAAFMLPPATGTAAARAAATTTAGAGGGVGVGGPKGAATPGKAEGTFFQSGTLDPGSTPLEAVAGAEEDQWANLLMGGSWGDGAADLEAASPLAFCPQEYPAQRAHPLQRAKAGMQRQLLPQQHDQRQERQPASLLEMPPRAPLSSTSSAGALERELQALGTLESTLGYYPPYSSGLTGQGTVAGLLSRAAQVEMPCKGASVGVGAMLLAQSSMSGDGALSHRGGMPLLPLGSDATAEVLCTPMPAAIESPAGAAPGAGWDTLRGDDMWRTLSMPPGSRAPGNLLDQVYALARPAATGVAARNDFECLLKVPLYQTYGSAVASESPLLGPGRDVSVGCPSGLQALYSLDPSSHMEGRPDLSQPGQVTRAQLCTESGVVSEDCGPTGLTKRSGTLKSKPTFKGRSQSERHRRDRMREAFTRLRQAVNSHGDTANMINDSINLIDEQRHRVEELELQLLQQRLVASLQPRGS